MHKRKKAIISIIVFILILLIFTVSAFIWKGTSLNNNNGVEAKAINSKETSKGSQNLFSTIIKSISSLNFFSKTEIKQDAGSEEAVLIVATGSSPISLETGEILTNTGEVARNEVDPGSQDAPLPSDNVNPDDLSEKLIKLSIGSNNISPKEFRVKAGEIVPLAVSSADNRTHIFRFESDSLKAVAVGLAPSETRVISFKAPLEKGEYVFFSAVADYRAKGSEGKMIVE